MYCNWSQAPEIRSLGTKLTVDANGFSSPAMLHNALHGPENKQTNKILLIQSHPSIFFIFPTPQPVSFS